MMTKESRLQKIESYGSVHTQLVSALAQFPREMWTFRPAPGEWTIHEIIIHIADSEANSYIRCRRFLAEPGSAVLGYDQEKWTSRLNYHAQDAQDALELFKYLRRMSYVLIKDLPEKTWSNTVIHSEMGEMTMEKWLDVYERHIPEHIAQMQRLFADWKKQQKK